MPYKNKIKQKEYQRKWDNNTTKERYEQLGIPFGTACHKLRQRLFFKYLKKAGENFCYDCKKEILTPEEVSIQHKKVWLHVSAELFWDFENIAFSHKKCNKQERHYYPNGELSKMAKLKNEDVFKIRQLVKESKYLKKDIAKMFNISDVSLRNIIKYRTWKHIGEMAELAKALPR